MFTDLHIETGPMIDLAVELEASAKRVSDVADKLQDRRTDFLQSTAGAASDAGVAQMQVMIDQLYIRSGKLTRNAKVMRKLVALYEQTDLAGARSFGA